MSHNLPVRSQLPEALTWDLSLLFESQADYEVAIRAFIEDSQKFQKTYQGKLDNDQVIVEALADYEQLIETFHPLSNYGELGYEVDKNDADYENNARQLGRVIETVGKTLSFFVSELATLDDKTLDAIIGSPAGQPYQYFLADIKRRKAVLLSPEIEETLSSLNQSIYSADDLYTSLKFQDLTFDDFQVDGQVYQNSFAGFEQDYEGHTDGAVRQAAWKSFHKGLAGYQHTAAQNYVQQVETEKKMATLRGFDSVIDYLLYDQKVSRDNYNQVIDTYTQEFAPVMRRYAKLLAENHNLDKVSLADIKMPYSTEETAKISVTDSRKLVEDALGILGDDYKGIVQRAFDERWIDFPMNQSKSTGGFCTTIYKGPSYILLNWTGLLSEVLVLAHELGHAGHFTLTYEDQLAITPEASLYFIEAPSTCNEVITCSYLLNQPLEDKEKQGLIAEFITRTYYHNMVTHLLEADFQRKVYTAVDNEEVLNAKKLNGFYRDTLEAFWGDAVVVSEGAELTWMRQPHYFMGLYSYTYSAGLTIGTQMGQKIASGDQEAIDNWLDVLKAGGTLTPNELAAKAGVDMEGKEALRSTIQFVDGMLDQIEALA